MTPQLIYQQTNGGLDIIGKYFPEAFKAAEKKSHKFRIVSEQEDPNPSCVLNFYNGIYKVYSFQAGESYSAIDIVMREENLDFSEAIKFISSTFNIENEEGKTVKISPDYRKRDAKDESDTFFDYEEDEELTVKDCQVVFAKNIWHHLCNHRTGINKEKLEGDELGLFNAKELFRYYNFKKLKWYEHLGRDKNDKNKRVIHRFISTETYPIFMFDEDYWQKIYKPCEPNSSYRFVSFGVKPKDYTFGIRQAEYKATELLQSADSEDEHIPKLKEIIICTGGSDALNVAAMGYNVVWFNSETIKKDTIPYKKLEGIAYKVYYLGDLDSTGKDESLKLGLEYLTLHLIDLPERLKTFRDDKNGKPCKDIKDYLQVFKVSDFRGLLTRSYPLQFWDEKYKKDRKGIQIMEFGQPVKEYKPDAELIYNFLQKHGFGRLKVLNAKEPVMVRIEDNTVSKIDGEYSRKFIKNFLRERNQDRRLINTFHRSPDLSDSSLESVNDIEIDFQDNDSTSQWMFFRNKHIRITADKIEEFSPKKSGKFVWDDEIVQVDWKQMLTPPFRVFQNDNGELDIEITNDACLYMRYLINTSRIHWRKELETELDKLPPKEREEYKSKYRWSIDGPLLSKEEIHEQKLHLINKLASLGYLLHRYKEPAQSFCVWAMDYVQKVGQSFGGTGKSIAYYAALSKMMKHHYIEGRKPDIAQNQFLLGAVNEHTDLIYIDDGHEYLDFTRFFSIVTGAIETMKKGLDAITLPFDISPKLCITSNFPPRSVDSATQRRMWFTAFSDYYHKNPNGEYREDRDPKSEFGKNLFKEFTKDEWNAFANTMVACVQVWFNFGKIDPPMKNVMENQYKAKMGSSFHQWADTFFSEENHLNDFLQRGYAFKSYQIETSDTKTSPNTWFEKINYWCLYNGYELNPQEYVSPKDGRIIKKEYKLVYRPGAGIFEQESTTIKKACEMIFIRTPDGKKEVRQEEEQVIQHNPNVKLGF